MAEPAKSLKVFVSYSRADVEFADQLVLALEDRSFDTILDRHDISGAENWRERLGKLILSADAVAFVLTAKSAASEICEWEVTEAKRLGKRIIPVTPASIVGVEIPATLGELNWIPFYAEPAIPGSGFYYGVKRTIEALSVDLEWLRSQTSYSERAAEWAKAKPEDLLLRGAALKEAQAWLTRTPATASPPNSVREYLAASADAEQRREAAARAQLVEREQAIKAAEAAIAEKQAAQAEKAKADRNLRVLTLGALAAGLVLVVFAVLGNWRAETTRLETSADRAWLLTQQANTLIDEGDSARGMLMAVLAQSVAKEGFWAGYVRPDGSPEAVAAATEARLSNTLELSVDARGPVTTLAVSPDEKTIVTGHQDGWIRFWDVGATTPKRELKAATRPITDIAFLRDGRRVVTTAFDGWAKIWSDGAGGALQVIEFDRPQSGSSLTEDDQKRADRDRGDGGVSLTSTSHIISLLPDDNRLLLVAQGYGWAKEWKIGEGAATPVLPFMQQVDDRPLPRTAPLSVGRLRGVMLAPGDDRAITLSNIGRVQLSSFGVAGTKPAFDENEKGVGAVAVYPGDRRFIASGDVDGTLKLRKIGTADTSFYGSQYEGAHQGEITAIEFSPDGHWLATASRDGDVVLWRVTKSQGSPAPGDEARDPADLVDVTFTVELVFHGHQSAIRSLAFLPGRNALVSGSMDGSTKFWRLPKAGTGVVEQRDGVDWIYNVAFAPDGLTYLSTGDVGELHIGKLASGETVQAITTDADNDEDDVLESTGFLTGGTRVITLHKDGVARLWKIGQPNALKVYAVTDPGTAFHISVFPGEKEFVSADERGVVKRFNIETGQQVGEELQAHEAWINMVDVSADGSMFVTAADDGLVRFWKLGSKEPFDELKFEDQLVLLAKFLPDGKHVFIGAGAASIEYWRIGDEKPLVTMELPRDASGESISIDSEGELALSPTTSSEALLWRVGETRPVQRFQLPANSSYFMSGAIAPDRKHVLLGTDSGEVVVYPIDPLVMTPPAERIARTCEELARIGLTSFTEKDVDRYPILRGQLFDPCVAMGVTKETPKTVVPAAKPSAPPAPDVAAAPASTASSAP